MDLPKIEPIVWGHQKDPEPLPVKTVVHPEPETDLPRGKTCYSTFTEAEEASILREVSRLLTDAGISFSQKGTEIFCSPNDMPRVETIFRAVLYQN